MKYGPFLIFWCIFCRNLRKIGYENEVCFEACRLPNFFWLFYGSLKKIMNSSKILHNFPLVYTLSIQKSNTCPEKILDIKKLFKKMWWKVSLIFIKFPLRSPTFVRNFWNFRSKFRSYNLQLITFPKRYFASKLTNKLPRYHQENVEKQEKIE